MRVAGIAVDVPSTGRPAGRIVVVNEVGGQRVIESVADFTSDTADLPVQLHDAAEGLRSRLDGVAFLWRSSAG